LILEMGRSRLQAWVVIAAAGFGLAACGGFMQAGSQAVSPRPAVPIATPTLRPPSSPLAGPVCAQGQVLLTVTTDGATYASGQPVVIDVSIRNTGPAPCNLPTGPCLPQVVISDQAGIVVWNRAATQVSCPYGSAYGLGPGAAAGETITWDGMRCAGRDPSSCPGIAVGPGTYRIVASWNSTRFGSTSVVIDAN
jgi:hypothetical protein